MSKRAQILAILIFVCLAVIVFLVFFSRRTHVENKLVVNQEKPAQVDLVKLEANYKKNVKEILTEYEGTMPELSVGQKASVSDKKNLSSTTSEQSVLTETDLVGQIENYKNRLLDLKVPTAFKDLHLNLVLALDKAETYFTSKDKKKLAESEELIKLAKNNYPWLAN